MEFLLVVCGLNEDKGKYFVSKIQNSCVIINLVAGANI